VEIAILIWFVIAAGIAAGAFIIARTAIQIASVAYNVLEKRLDPRVATRQTIALTLAGIAALVATSIIAGIAILAMLQGLVNASGLNQ
jgi:limonene-1,2-epoxide hydrolase